MLRATSTAVGECSYRAGRGACTKERLLLLSYPVRLLLLTLTLLMLTGASLLVAPAPPALASTGFKTPAGSLVQIDAGAPSATVIGTLTVTEPEGPGFLTAFPCTSARPNASNLNFVAGQTIATGAVVRTDANGQFCVFSSTTAHVIWDQTAETGLPAHPASRIVDTRNTGFLPANSALRIPTGAPSATVFGTLTTTGPAGPGFLTAYPCSSPIPVASNLNYSAGQTIATGTTVRTDANGDICVFSNASTHVIWDQVSENTLPSHPAFRVVDTRTSAVLVAGQTLRVRAGVPLATILGTVTAVDPRDNGYLTVYSCSQPRPNASNLNYATGQTIATGTSVAADANGDICIYTHATTHVIWDQIAETEIGSHNATRLLDTRTLSAPRHPRTGAVFPAAVSRWTGTVMTVLAERGLDQKYLPGVLAQIQQESSGIPTAVNGYDSNWRSGYASFGLLQMIFPTYQAYAKPGYAGVNQPIVVNGITQRYTPYMTDPYYNLWAALNYVQGRYGTARLDAWNSGNNVAY